MIHRKRYFKYHCEWCFFTCQDDEQRMKNHLLKKHGVTGKFGKGYYVVITHRNPQEVIK